MFFQPNLRGHKHSGLKRARNAPRGFVFMGKTFNFLEPKLSHPQNRNDNPVLRNCYTR